MILPVDSFVVDASVAAKWRLSDEEHADTALRVLDDFFTGRIRLFAPGFIRLEVASALTVATMGRSPRLAPQSGREAIDEFLAIDIATVADDTLVAPAYSLARKYGCAIYDALYLALAQRLSLRLITADARFYRRVGTLPEILWLPDYSPAA